MARTLLTDARWERLRPLLPPQRARTGRPARDHRQILEGILWVLRTGAPWRDLPQEFGPWQTYATRYYRWVQAGIWTRVLEELQRQSDATGMVDWSLHQADGSVIRAHQHAAGARKRGPRALPLAEDTAGVAVPPAGPAPETVVSSPEDPQPDEALGRSQGGFSTKLHLRVDRTGKILTFLITAGQRHEQTAFYRLMERGAIKRRGRGRPRVRPERLAADKGDSSRTLRRYLRRRGIKAVIPTKKNERRSPHFDKAAYRERNVVERTINRLKQFRRIATRYEKRAVSYLAMLTLAAIVLWL